MNEAVSAVPTPGPPCASPKTSVCRRRPGREPLAGPATALPKLSLLTSTALSATYPVSLKLIYAAEGAPLSPAVITSLRFALMAAGVAFIFSMISHLTGGCCSREFFLLERVPTSAPHTALSLYTHGTGRAGQKREERR